MEYNANTVNANFNQTIKNYFLRHWGSVLLCNYKVYKILILFFYDYNRIKLINSRIDMFGSLYIMLESESPSI